MDERRREVEFEEKSSSSYCEVYGAGNPNFLRSKASEAVEIERASSNQRNGEIRSLAGVFQERMEP